MDSINITGGSRTGGLVGRTGGTTSIKNCGTKGYVYGRADYCCIGGLVGGAYGNFTIANSYSHAAVNTNVSWSGGLVGDHYTGKIINSYATGSVVGCSARCGGLSGQLVNSGSIINSFSTGSLSGCSSYCGGLFGIYYSGTSSGNYWDYQTSGMATSAGGTGKTTAQMQTQSTFAGWDFENDWCMPEGDYPRLKFEDACSLPTCTGCAVLSGRECVAGDSCSGEHPNCVVTDNDGICECSASSCNAGRSCSTAGICSDCDNSEGCGSCTCGTSQKPTGTGACINDSSCCVGECNMATGANFCSYSDDLCSSGIACNRSTLSCCASSLPYWRSSDCKPCAATSGLSGTCQTKGMMCNSNYDCVSCLANMQCTCDDGFVSDGAGGCIEPLCYTDSECGTDKCINAGDYDAFCSNCSSINKVWVSGSCESCPSGSTYHNGICLCSDGKMWNSASNTCSKKSVISSHGVIDTKSKATAITPESRYDRIKRKMNRITNSAYAGVADKEELEELE
ncbi:MAG: GLUG motif-containing protein [Alphaproteobacteria bacterium]